MSSLRSGRCRVLAAFVLWLLPAIVYAESVTLAWDASSGATGYTVKWGTTLGSYPNSASAGSSTSFAINGLVGGATYWTVVQAYNSAGMSESTPFQFTVPVAVACTYSINPASVSITAPASTGTLVVTTQTGCAWTATSGSGFLTVDSSAGRTGSGSIGFSVAANTGSSSRTGTATVAGKTFTVTQAAPAACSYSINPTSVSVSAASSTGTITVTTDPGCAWSTSSSSGFLTFQNGSGRTGSGTVGFTVATNTTTKTRTGNATVAGKGFTVSQAPAGATCSYSISPTSVSPPSAGTTGTISVTTQSGCAWSATSAAGFLTFANGSGRTGSGTVTYTVAANADSYRTGAGTVAGQSFTVWQTGPICTYTVSPTSISTSAEATTGTMTVTTQSGCNWNATSMSDFVSFTSGTGRTGTGSVSYSIAANPTTSARTGIAAVAAATVYVNQAGTIVAPPPPPASPWSSDFDGDGRNDILVHDSVSGSAEAWFLDGATVKGTRSLSHTMDINWMLVGRGDFNADGKADLVWQHKTEGWINIWFMDGTTRTGTTEPSISRLSDPRWQVVGVGDLNADGKPDLVWQHSGDGALAVWQMNGIAVTATVSIIPDRTTDLMWKVVGVADFNADGKTDLLWRHMGAGDVGVWLMDGVSRIIYAPLTPFYVPDQRWQIGAVTDANGDGKPDLFWEHTDGTIMIWHMDGTSRTTYPIITRTVPLGWHIVGPK